MARLLAAFLMTAVVTAPATAQTDTRPAFAVATVKKNTSGDAAQTMRLQPGGRIVVTNQPLRRLIVFAYGLQPQQLTGGPAWLDTDRFDIVAQAEGNLSPTPPGGPPGSAQLMMQRLLAERFGLVVHTESREMPVYALTLARGDGRLGPRIKPATVDCLALMTQAPGGVPVAAPQLPDGRPACGARRDGTGRVMAGGTDMKMLATQMLTGQVDRLVVDRTGLTGAYDFDLEYALDTAGRGGAPSPDSATAVTDRPSLFTALEEQLGLKLQPQRAPVDVLVIDRITPPTEN
ncbi:MAG TPA: TIGR03435 family protein [Vicinamibacterales bacterium]|jgi:uncharacterized protein (TIGR03435 family)|nr:TIGR03435 family protein [Vicinamibacterales bacterium]